VVLPTTTSAPSIGPPIGPPWPSPPTRPFTENDDEIAEEFRSYCEHLFAPKPSQGAQPLLDALRARTVPPDLKTKLDKPITSEEVVTAIQRLAHGKTPGPDGLPAEFYQEFHPELAPLLHAVFLEATQTGHFPADITQGDISFHFKKGDPREVRNYRPISLLQVDYKIFSHILVRRIKLTLDHIISREQLGFVPKRLIGEATHLLKLIQAYLADENKEGLILTLDWEKAFDRCSWSYHHAALSALDFEIQLPLLRQLWGPPRVPLLPPCILDSCRSSHPPH
jgi:hypothetical protein